MNAPEAFQIPQIIHWTFQRKISFNSNPSKQAQEVIFSRKSKRPTHPPLVFNNNNVSQTFSFERHYYCYYLVLTGAIRGKSKTYQELVLESLRRQRWFRRLYHFHKVLENENPKHLSA